jgi:hypothetical protein
MLAEEWYVTSASSASAGKPAGERTDSKAHCKGDRDRAERIAFDTIGRIINQILGGITATLG